MPTQHQEDPNLRSGKSAINHPSNNARPSSGKKLTSNQPLIQPIHPLHIPLINPPPQLPSIHIRILLDPLPLHALRQNYVALLQIPTNHQLRRRALVFL
jgi:hypothetical protein